MDSNGPYTYIMQGVFTWRGPQLVVHIKFFMIFNVLDMFGFSQQQKHLWLQPLDDIATATLTIGGIGKIWKYYKVYLNYCRTIQLMMNIKYWNSVVPGGIIWTTAPISQSYLFCIKQYLVPLTKPSVVWGNDKHFISAFLIYPVLHVSS